MTTSLQGDCQVRAAGKRPEEREALLPVAHRILKPSFFPTSGSCLACDKSAGSTLQDSGSPSQWGEWPAKEGSAQAGTTRLSIGYKQLSLVSLCPPSLDSSSAQSQGAASLREVPASCSFPQLLLPLASIHHYLRPSPRPTTCRDRGSSKVIPPICRSPRPQPLMGLCWGSHVMYKVHGLGGIRLMLLQKDPVIVAFPLQPKEGLTV